MKHILHSVAVFLDSENPQVIEESPLHPEKVTVWCTVCSEGVIGPYFFENDNGTTITINSERYCHMITDFFLPTIEYDLENMQFQQDGATCHTTRTNMALLQETFPGGVISRHGDISWPPKLTPLDFAVLRENPCLCR